MPDFSIEKEYNNNVVGIDEVGRGPLAGPVIIATLSLRFSSNKFSGRLVSNYSTKTVLLARRRLIFPRIMFNEIGAFIQLISIFGTFRG